MLTAVLTLIFAALADSAEQTSLQLPAGPEAEKLGWHLQSLLSHAAITVEGDRLRWVEGEFVEPDTQVHLVRWLVENRSYWWRKSGLDDPKPRMNTYLQAGRHLRPVLEWFVEQKIDPRGLDWDEAHRRGMRHAMRKPLKPDPRWVLGPAGIGPVVYRFLGEPDRSRRSTTQEAYLSGKRVPFGTQTRNWTVQHLNRPELIKREMWVMGLVDDYEYGRSDSHWFSLRDESGKPLLTFIADKTEDTPEIIVLSWGGTTILDFVRSVHPENVYDILRLGAEFLIYLQPDPKRWWSDTVPLSFYADNQRPFTAWMAKYSDMLIRKRPSMYALPMHKLIQFEARTEDPLPDIIFEQWYELTKTPKEDREPGHAETRPLPYTVAKMQLERLGIDSEGPLTSALNELEYELEEDSDGSTQMVHEARFVGTPSSPEHILQILLWWQGEHLDGEWAATIAVHKELFELVIQDHSDISVLDEGAFFDLARNKKGGPQADFLGSFRGGDNLIDVQQFMRETVHGYLNGRMKLSDLTPLHYDGEWLEPQP